MNELISVIINVYNGEKYIKKCLDSVINQTYKNLEILIINDGSKDGTINIVNSYNDKRIRLINNEKNIGLSLSRNIAIDNSKGEYLYFVDVDDYLKEDTVEYLYNLCKKYDVKMSTCACKEVYSYDYVDKKISEKILVSDGKDLLDKVLLSINRIGATWNKLYKKELFDNIRFEDRIINDVVVTYKLALKLDKYVYSNQIKYICFRHSDSIMSSHKANWDIDLYDAAIERYNYIKNIYPKYIENDICMNSIIIFLYEHNNEVVDHYLEDKKARDLYKKLFSIRLIFYKLGFKTKIKMILYKVSPKLFRKIVNKYSNRKR